MAKSSKKKKKTNKTNKKSSFFSKKKISLFLLSLITSIALVYGYNYYNAIKTNKKVDKSTEVLMNKMKKMLDDEKERLTTPKTKDIPKKLPPVVKHIEPTVEKNITKKIIIEKKTPKPKIVKKEKKKTIAKYNRPKLAIIIDDVSYPHHIKLIKKIPYKITPSFFPPTPRHPETVRLSKKFSFAMVHLPTEATNFNNEEPQTLKVGDSIASMRKRIQQLKRWFPNLTYYNNHTGSKFTADLNSMDKLLRVMREEKLHFVDSRTTAKTKAPKLAKRYGLKLYQRDVFLDNDTQKHLIKRQLKKAVKIAKKRGYAIAIGHPHSNTLSVIKNAKDIFRGVDLVYLKDL